MPRTTKIFRFLKPIRDILLWILTLRMKLSHVKCLFKAMDTDTAWFSNTFSLYFTINYKAYINAHTYTKAHFFFLLKLLDVNTTSNFMWDVNAHSLVSTVQGECMTNAGEFYYHENFSAINNNKKLGPRQMFKSRCWVKIKAHKLWSIFRIINNFRVSLTIFIIIHKH